MAEPALTMPRPLRSVVLSLGCQTVGLAAGLAANELIGGAPGRSFAAALALVIAVHSGAAFLTALLCGLSRPWQLLNLLLPASVVTATLAAIPGWVYASAAALGLLLFLPAFWSQVPYYPTDSLLYDQVAELLPTDRPFTFLDAGCGFGGLLVDLSRRFPNGRFEGIELGPLPYLVSLLRTVRRPNARIRFSDLWKRSLADVDVLYCFLAPPPMKRLYEKWRAESPDGSTAIVNSFPFPSEHAETVELGAASRQRLFIYRK